MSATTVLLWPLARADVLASFGALDLELVRTMMVGTEGRVGKAQEGSTWHQCLGACRC